ncbi:hypothetical protein VTK56DRAFT_980 [Thermocarpiscus australiensis]
MDQQHSRGRRRSPSATSTGGVDARQPSLIRNAHSPSPARFPNPNEAGSSSIGLGLGLVDPTAQQYAGAHSDFSAYDANASSFLSNQQSVPQPFSQPGLADPSTAVPFDLTRGFADQFKADSSPFASPNPGHFPAQTQQQQSPNLLAPTFADADITIFPPTPGEPQFDTPLFASDSQQQFSSPDTNMMSHANHNPTPPHLLNPDAHQPTSANQSQSFGQHQMQPSSGRHSRNVSLGPEAALLPGQIDWSLAGPQFQGHRRSPSEYSDVSSAAPSPHLVSSDAFDQLDQSHSPMQRPQDTGLYNELHGIGSFTISDPGTHSPSHGARSPSLSPAISPRIAPQQLPDMSQQGSYLLNAQNNGFGQSSYLQGPQEAFPQLPQDAPDVQQQGSMPAPPSINIDFAPTAVKSGFEQPKNLDVDSLTPPERGRTRLRPRAVTDPYNSSGALLSSHRSISASGGLSPDAAADTRSESGRSLSPLDRASSASSNRRRQSTSAVPNNIIALRLADPGYNGGGAQGEGGPKRVQKHPATFQCDKCPKRFTRAYNLRSHRRTHTDERPFVCAVCGKAFARAHDKKRHEGLHSGEKKFVCKGDLKNGGQWGCGRRFARADALGRHFRSEAGRICIKPLLDEEMHERQRLWNEQRMQQAAAQGMMMQAPGMMMPPGMDQNAGGYPMDPGAHNFLPQALLAQYPALEQFMSAADMGGGSGIEDELSGGSAFEASDYDDGDDGGYVSGPGSGFGPSGMQENFGEMGYASDYGGR